MNVDKKFYDIRFLIFSSHKTATQSLVKSLNYAGIPALHIHDLLHLGAKPGEFLDYVGEYKNRNGCPINIISVYRDPIDRLISSFFQSLEIDVYGRTEEQETELLLPEESVLHKESFKHIQNRFYLYCKNSNVYKESLHQILSESRLNVSQLHFSNITGFGENNFELFNLYLYRYDFLIKNFESLLKMSTGWTVKMWAQNLSQTKWYYPNYVFFKRDLKIPENLIRDLYQKESSLINLFYPGQYDRILNDKILRWG